MGGIRKPALAATPRHAAPPALPGQRPIGIAILGCGFVADFYMATIGAHPMLRIVGAYDRKPDRLAAFCRHHGLLSFRDLDHLLAAPEVEMVLNLTNPASHFALTRACLEAGRHVYSEKPLAMASVEAAELAALAQRQGLHLAAAPASLLGETAQTMWKAVRDGAIGRVRLVHANFHDGMIHRQHPERWRSASGAPWPVEDEFATGCTYEHAGYVLTWLAAFFGPARRVHAFAACQLPEKGVAGAAGVPDLTEGCLEYDGNIVARVSCSLVAPPDRSITIIGDEGVLHTPCVRDDAAPVYLRREAPGRLAAQLGSTLGALRNRLEHALRVPWSLHGLRLDRRYAFARRPAFRSSARNKPVDFLRGPAELAEAIREGRPCRLSAELGVHITELVETLQYPERFGPVRTIGSTFPPIAPLTWKG
ncbi:Gfo/Idh/MocA family protein [Falsiroseomonas sp.]|uniref:Gfo/Idh/MocA family protein n=1 Tax=Falsiroseomonas sp. TaxID=2870721 RepID=UPI003569416B